MSTSSKSAAINAPLLAQFDHVCGKLRVGGRFEPRIEIGIDTPAQLRNRARAGGDGVEHLALALEAVGDVLVDQRYGVVTGGAVPRMNAARLESAERLQRSDVVAHVPVGRKDRRRPRAEDRVACEEIAVGGEIADMLV